MPKCPNNTGAPVYCSPVRVAFTYPAISETIYGEDPVPVALPASEPATAQISYTIAAGHLPTLTGTPVRHKKSPLLWFGVMNADEASAQSLSFNVYKNGVLANGESAYEIASTYSAYVTYMPVDGNGDWDDFAVDDVLTVKLWGTSANLMLFYHGMCIVPNNPAYGSNRVAIWGRGLDNAVAYDIEATSVGPSIGTSADDTHDGDYLSYESNAYTLTPQSPRDIIWLDGGKGAMEHYYNSFGFDGEGAKTYITTNDGGPVFYYIKRITAFACQPLNIKI